MKKYHFFKFQSLILPNNLLKMIKGDTVLREHVAQVLTVMAAKRYHVQVQSHVQEQTMTELYVIV